MHAFCTYRCDRQFVFTLGLVLAALIIGAAMLMEVETSFRILGYPGLAILCFLGAAVGGVLLVANIVTHDWHSGGERPGKRERRIT